MNKRYKRRLVACCMAAVAAALAGVHALVFAFGQEDIQDQLESSAKGIAVSVAQIVAMDAGAYREFLRTRDTGSAYYRKMQDRLASIKRESGAVKYIYTERRLDAKSTEFILDAEPIGGPRYSPPGSEDPNNPQKEMAFASNATVGRRSADGDKWGRLIAAYSPLLGEDGENLGLVGVDMDGRHLYRQFYRINRAMTLANLMIMGLSLACLLGFSDAILDRLMKDKLTGAFTKRHFDALLGDEVSRAARHRRGLALLMLDLDRFKSVNDTYGHVFGDRVLASAAEAIRGAMRSDDTLVRYGGEEFAVILADADPGAALEAAERLRRAVAAAPVLDEETGAAVAMTVSVGVANHAGPQQSARDLVECADRALYEAKAKRNAVAVFDCRRSGGGDRAGGGRARLGGPQRAARATP